MNKITHRIILERVRNHSLTLITCIK